MTDHVVAPYSEQAEQAVLGGILVDPEQYANVAGFLTAKDFYLLRHSHIWAALSRLADRRDPIDILTVAAELDAMKLLEDVGDRPYLTELINSVPTAMYTEVYARLVQRAAVRRKLLQASDRIKALAFDEETPVEEIISESEATIMRASESMSIGQDYTPIFDGMSRFYDGLSAAMVGKKGVGVPTGLRDLDHLLGGLHPSDLHILAGRPGMGKTSVLLNMALNVAKAGYPVALHTMEMGVEQMCMRWVAMESGVHSIKLREGSLTPLEAARVTTAIGELSSLPIFIDDTSQPTPIDVRTKAMRLQHQHGLFLLMIDYLQLMGVPKQYRGNRVTEVSYISRHLKEMARDLNVVVLAASQLSRAVEQRQNKRPLMSDLRESGTLEQDADVVTMLYRDAYYNENSEYPNSLDINVVKHRNGPTGTVSVYYEASCMKVLNNTTNVVDLSDLDSLGEIHLEDV